VTLMLAQCQAKMSDCLLKVFTIQKAHLKNLVRRTRKESILLLRLSWQNWKSQGTIFLNHSLSREEIIDPECDKIGLSLGEDPFFQYIKSNRLAREIVIGPNRHFSPEEIVRLALRQDIQIDNASSTTPKTRYEKENLTFEEYFTISNNQLSNKEILEPRDYFSHEKGLNAIDYENDNWKRVLHPVPRNYRAGEARREIDHDQLHWRNTSYLATFLNSHAKILPRKYSRLTIAEQKLIARIIKRARKMRLLPSKAFLMPHHRIPLRTIEDDLEDATVRKIDLENGTLYVQESPKNWEDPYSHDISKEEAHISMMDEKY